VGAAHDRKPVHPNKSRNSQIFRFQRVGLTPENKIIGHFTATGVRSNYAERFKMWGYDLPPSIYEPFNGNH
jgi:pilus assembly protein CpaF